MIEINLIISDSPGSQNSVLDNVQKTYTVYTYRLLYVSTSCGVMYIV